MLDTLNNACLAVADPLLGWLLHVPRDVALTLIALGTALYVFVPKIIGIIKDILARLAT